MATIPTNSLYDLLVAHHGHSVEIVLHREEAIVECKTCSVVLVSANKQEEEKSTWSIEHSNPSIGTRLAACVTMRVKHVLGVRFLIEAYPTEAMRDQPTWNIDMSATWVREGEEVTASWSYDKNKFVVSTWKYDADNPLVFAKLVIGLLMYIAPQNIQQRMYLASWQSEYIAGDCNE